MTRTETIELLVEAIERIEHSFTLGNMEDAINEAIALKNEVRRCEAKEVMALIRSKRFK